MTSRLTTTTTSRPARRRIVAFVGAGLLALSIAGAASAKEVGSGGTPPAGGGAAACSPVSSLTAKADPRVGELGFASVAVSYGVKPCDAQPVTVTTDVFEWLNPANVAWNDTAAPLNGKFTVNGIRVRTTYKVTVTVLSAADGSVVGSSSIFTAAIPKGV